MNDTESLAPLFARVIEELGEDLKRDGLADTPQRAARAFRYLTSGYGQDLTTVINGAVYRAHGEDLVIVQDIAFYSLCEHHLLPFFGKCHVGYVPDGLVLGVSKVARITDVFARRLQLQERLTRQIAEALHMHTGAHGVGVVIEAQHLCMMMRGVEKENSRMKTSCMLGSFLDNEAVRSEFLRSIR
ncbi:MAG TPA: GTP cyclohydrolase I FolE [Atribacteraceae bacterium]|nr:GTP cyclohydrolase I FolE [Atribacteraceae bacterium]